MPIPNLPPQRRDSEVTQAKAGAWTHSDASLLQVARGLRVNEENAFRDADEPIRAIPDPWSQARTFGEALLDEKHTVHATSLRQWRGLLALLALQPTFGKAYQIALKSAALAPPGTQLFSDVLRSLRPSIALGDQVEQWDSPWLISCNGVLAAMTNPICLVSPGRSVNSLSIAAVPWMRAGVIDPLTLEGDSALSVTQLVALQGWLDQLYAHVVAIRGKVAEKIAALIRDFRDAVAAEGGDANLGVAISPSIENLPPLLDPLMARAEVAGDTPEPRTRIKLDHSIELGGLKGLILVDEAVSRLPGYHRRTTFVWGMATLGELLGNPQLLEQVRGEAAAAGYMIVTLDDLMTNRLVKLYAGREDVAPSISGHPAQMQDMLLPIRPLSLLTGGGDLASRLKCQAGSDRASVTFTVMLDNGTSEGQPLELTRHYSTGATGGEPLFVPKAEWRMWHTSMWPDFKSTVWTRYYLRFYYDPEFRSQMVLPHAGLSAARVGREIAGLGEPQVMIKRLRDINDGDVPTVAEGEFERSVAPPVDNLHDEIQFSSIPFEAIAYFEAGSGRSAAFAGLAIPKLESRQPAQRATTVAVDFGTTNTVACIGTADAEPLTFKKRLLFPIQSRNPETQRNTLQSTRHYLTRFLPPEERSSPTATVAYSRLAYPSSETVGVFKNLIYFHSSQPIAANGEEDELREFARFASAAQFNLKWSKDEAVIAAATDFLDQYMIMAAAEVTATIGHDPRMIRWRFSVPDSLGSKETGKFRDYLAGKAAEISTGIDSNALEELYSEGLAAAVCLLEGSGFNTRSLNMVLDIGGGTTDATILERKELRWRGSFRIAGQDFFTRLLSQNPEILEKIELTSWANIFKDSVRLPDTMQRADLPHLAELLFSGTGTGGSSLDLQKMIDKHWALRLNMESGAPLRAAGLVFIAGIAWYLGRVVHQLIDDGSIEDVELAKRPSFALCGRGAGLFKKIHGGRAADDDSDVTQAMKVYSEAAQQEDARNPQFLSSSAAKLEVARGMLVSNPTIDCHLKTGGGAAKRYQPAGLALTLRDGTRIGPDDHVGADVIRSEVRSVDLAELDRFIATLRTVGQIAIDLRGDRPQGARDAIVEAVEKKIEDALKDAARSGTAAEIEPPFISALRALVAEIAAPRAVREARIGVEFL